MRDSPGDRPGSPAAPARPRRARGHAERLSGDGRTVVAKIVPPAIPHKQKIGGVRRTAASAALYVQFVLTRMREEVLSHFACGETPETACFLLVEYVPHTRVIGYEVLVGFREGPASRPRSRHAGLPPSIWTRSSSSRAKARGSNAASARPGGSEVFDASVW